MYLYLSLVHNKVALARRLLPIFHVISWGLPLVIVVPVLSTRHLGYSYYAASTWCYIKAPNNATNDQKTIEMVLVLVAGKFWEISTYLFVIVFYVLIKRHISIQVTNFEQQIDTSHATFHCFCLVVKIGLGKGTRI